MLYFILSKLTNFMSFNCISIEALLKLLGKFDINVKDI